MRPLEVAKVVLPAVGMVLLILLIAAVWLRRVKSEYRIRKMPMWEKLEKINALAEPFGFFYVKSWDIFSTRKDAWQRDMGYESLYDAAAVSVHMVMDAWPVYFDYEGRTWMIEFWKGQYGISSGAEVGVYHADHIVMPHEYKYTHFKAADEEELPWIRNRLSRDGETLYTYAARHWWLTGFSVGRFSKPQELVLNTAITFDSEKMAKAFCEGLERSADCDIYERCKSRVYVRFKHSPKAAVFTRLHRAWAQMWNRFWVRVFLFATKPFLSSVDRLLFLYEQIPGCLKCVLGFDRRRYRRKHRKGCRP